MLGCGGDLHAQQGAIESPNHPQRYPSNTECVWQINVNNGYHVNLNFEPPFELEIQEPCSGDFVEVSVLSLGLHGKIICIISARQRSCGKVMFSQASVCSQGCGGGYSPPPTDGPGIRLTNGYASYWNAFLFFPSIVVYF